MLDQNTDRHLWAIIAVLLGGAAWLVLKVAFPELLQQIIDLFKSQIPTTLG